MSPQVRVWLLDTFERATSTLIQHLILFMPLLMGAWDASAAQALAASAVSALVTVVLSGILYRVPKPATLAGDIVNRIARTFAATIGGLLTADGFNVLSWVSWKSALIVAGMAVLVAIKGIWAERVVPDSITPASFVTMRYGAVLDRGYTLVEVLVGIAAALAIIFFVVWLFGGDRFD